MASGKFAFMILLVILVAAAIFITQKIEQLLVRLTRHMGKRMRKNRSYGIYHLLAPSLICTCVCMVCLCGASWAWFSAAYTSPVAGITAAVYDVEVTVADSTDGEADVPVTSQNLCRQLSLDAGHIYNVEIRATGTARSGYCSVTIDGTTYYTPQISPSSEFTFVVKANQASTMEIIPQWGTCAVSDSNITSGAIIEFGISSSEDPVDVVSDPPAGAEPAGSDAQSAPSTDAQPAGTQSASSADAQPFGTQPAPSEVQPAPQTNSTTSSQSSATDVQAPVGTQSSADAQSPADAQSQTSTQSSADAQPAPPNSSVADSQAD